LKEALNEVAAKEGSIKYMSHERINSYEQLQRLGYVSFTRKAVGMGIVVLTESGREYLDNE
jgi:hypothetical protein